MRSRRVAVAVGILTALTCASLVSVQMLFFGGNDETCHEANVHEWFEDPDRLDTLLKANQIKAADQDGESVDLETTQLELSYEGGTLYIERTFANDTILLTPQKGKPGPELIPSSDYRLYTFSGPSDDIFLLDPVTLGIEQITSDQTEGYSKEELMQTSQPGGTLLWAYEPLVSGDNQIVSYLTNRRSIQEGDHRDDIWAIDLHTGAEELIVKNGRSIFWNGRTLYFLDTETNNIRSYNYDTKETEDKLVGIELYQALGDKWIASSLPFDETVSFYNVANEKNVEMRVDPSSRVTFNFRISPDERKVLGTIFVDRKAAAARQFFIFDLESERMELIKIPGQKPELAEIQGWINNEQFVANIRSDDERSSRSLLIDIKATPPSP